MLGLSLVAASGGHSSSRCAGLSLSRPLLVRSTGSRRAGSVVVAHEPSCSAACGILPDQGSNPCPLHWQADSQPLRHQGSPAITLPNIRRNLFFQSKKTRKFFFYFSSLHPQPFLFSVRQFEIKPRKVRNRSHHIQASDMQQRFVINNRIEWIQTGLR